MIWQILIATTTDRRPMFDALMNEFDLQIDGEDLHEEVRVIYDEDQKQKTVGRKRQDLLERADAEYISFFDSDDFPYPCYVPEIYNALLTGCDSVGFLIDMTTNGKNHQVCCHSLRYKKWDIKKDGYDYVRNVTHFNPCKRELALKAGFNPALRFGEDKEYSDKVTALCKTEVFINKPLFHYRYSNLIEHKKKYGFER